MAAWTFLQFFEWILNRYEISPKWVDLFLWIFVGAIPSVLIYLYHQDRINKRVLNLREKIIFPLNIVLIMVITYFVFGSADLGATTKEISYTNSLGDLEHKRITKEAFRIGMPIFAFDQKSGDSASLWLGNGISTLLYYDLAQDKNMTLRLFHKTTTTEKIKISKTFNKHYLDGEFYKKDGSFYIKTFLRKSKNGKIIFEYKQGNTIASAYHLYDPEKKEWLLQEEEKNYFTKDLD